MEAEGQATDQGLHSIGRKQLAGKARIMAQRMAFWTFASIVLWLAAAGAGRAQGSSGPAADTAPPAPKVTGVSGTIEADDLIEVHVDHLAEWASATNDPGKLIPYINGLGLHGNYPDEVHTAKNHLHYHLRITPENKDTWVNLMGATTGLRRPVTFSVGLEKQSPFDTVFDSSRPLSLVVVDTVYGLIALVVVLVTMIVFVRLARTTNLIREPASERDDGGLGPYSLGRTQMGFWFLLVCLSYVVIWLVTGALDTITASLLGLMGISAGTALGEAMIKADARDTRADQLITLTAQKQAIDQGLAELQSQPSGGDPQRLEEARTRQFQISQQIAKLTPSGPPARSRGFMRDILSGGADYSLHRFQMSVWTIVLGIMFLSSVYNNLTMPDFSATLLGLMGISSGTYIGFQFPEKK